MREHKHHVYQIFNPGRGEPVMYFNHRAQLIGKLVGKGVHKIIDASETRHVDPVQR